MGMRSTTQPLPTESMRDDTRSAKAGKSSFRNTVRKIFGRRSKDLEPRLPQRSPPRHAYHRSEPPAFSSPRDERVDTSVKKYAPQRTLSAPLHVIPSPSLGRVRSPYAVEFPHTARLKPLNISPYTAQGSQLRRRKTLPSVLLNESEAASLAGALSNVPKVPVSEHIRTASVPDTASSAISRIKVEKRRSRSAGDLRDEALLLRPERKRSEEITFWRESFQGSVLRASGFTTAMISASASEDKDKDVVAQTSIASDPFTTQSPGSRAGTSHGGSPSQHNRNFSAGSGFGTELSRDLEDRVAKLEAGLRTFQQSLHRMTADRNRRTVLLGSAPRRSSIDARTPSMLADTLMSGWDQTGSQHHYEETQRPSTSPQPPRTPIRGQPGDAPPLPSERYDRVVTTPPPMRPGQTHHQTTRDEQPHTFRSLYEMLANERSERRRLESQLRNVRQEVAELQTQVSWQSGDHSRVQSGDGLDNAKAPFAGSSRIRELLRETEGSPSSNTGNRDSNATGFSSINPRVVSRFSGTESEAGAADGEADELTTTITPYEEYKTPWEERSRFHFGSGVDGDMF